MCFSASASFIASGGLAVASAVTLKAAPKKQKIIAAIPLFFAIQQALEGFVWLSLNAGTTNLVAGYGFLSVALLVWPIYIPMAVYLLDRRRRHVMHWFVALGVAVAAFLAWQLLSHPLTIGIFGRCIAYSLDVPFLLPVVLAYVVAVCGAPLFSSRKAFQIFGAVAFVSSLAAAFFFFETFTSVWCFFMAFLSLLILFYFERE
jgi:hypothetical protein